MSIVVSSGSTILLVHDLSALHCPNGNKTESLTLKESDARASIKESLIVQLRHHLAHKHLIFALLINELYCIEAQSKQVICSAAIDACSPLFNVFKLKFMKLIVWLSFSLDTSLLWPWCIFLGSSKWTCIIQNSKNCLFKWGNASTSGICKNKYFLIQSI